MPIFEYRCRGCRRSFERIVLGAAEKPDAIECPQCGGRGAERLVSRFATSAKSASDDFGGTGDGDFGGEDFEAEDAGGGRGGGFGGPAGGEEDEFGGSDEDTDEAFATEDGEDDD